MTRHVFLATLSLLMSPFSSNGLAQDSQSSTLRLSGTIPATLSAHVQPESSMGIFGRSWSIENHSNFEGHARLSLSSPTSSSVKINGEWVKLSTLSMPLGTFSRSQSVFVEASPHNKKSDAPTEIVVLTIAAN